MTTLTQARLKELLNYDPETGQFIWKVTLTSTAQVGGVAGACYNQSYRRIGIRGAKFLAHRLAWFYVYGVWPVGDIDHVNGNKDDNRIENLRDVPHHVNLQNRRRANKNNNQKLLGVKASGFRWVARISIGGRERHLGTFTAAEEAHQAYLTAKRQHHQGNTL